MLTLWTVFSFQQLLTSCALGFYLPLCVILFLGEQAPVTLALPCAFRDESEETDCFSLGPEPFIQKEGKAGSFPPASLL